LGTVLVGLRSSEDSFHAGFGFLNVAFMCRVRRQRVRGSDGGCVAEYSIPRPPLLLPWRKQFRGRESKGIPEEGKSLGGHVGL
jgi:hypothetical protein